MLLEYIKNRRSTVAFSHQLVEQEKLHLLFEAAHLAPSSGNAQPWRFIYSTQESPAEFALLFDCLDEGNQRWVKNASVLGITVAETIVPVKNITNKYAMHDTGIASGLLMIQAMALGLRTHFMGGFDPEKAKINMQIPEPYEPIAMFAIGYHGSTEGLPEYLIKRENSIRSRKPLDEIVFKDKFK